MTNANDTTNANTNSAASTEGAPSAEHKAVTAFYTRKDDTGPAVVLFVNEIVKPRTPAVGGTIGGVQVAGVLQEGPKSGFFNFIDSKADKDENGHYKKVATGNVVANQFGIPKLVLTMEGDKKTIWVEVSLNAPLELLVSAGLDLELQASRKAEHALKKAAKLASEQPAA